MKKLIITLALLASQASFARQYFQCSVMDYNSTDVMVINLQTNDQGTLFLSSGMQNPEDERILLKIALGAQEKDKHVFNIVNGAEGSIEIPSAVIGKRADSVVVHLSFNQLSFDYSCFARVYND